MITIINIPGGAAGWVIEKGKVKSFFLGQDKNKVKELIKKLKIEVIDKTDIEGLTEKVEKYFLGQPVDFSKIPVELSGLSPFAVKLLNTLRKEVGYGEKISYGSLAVLSGLTSKHSRAIGSVMRKNPVPVIIPCHRVVMKDNSIGGYSAGLKWKKILLKLEGII